MKATRIKPSLLAFARVREQLRHHGNPHDPRHVRHIHRHYRRALPTGALKRLSHVRQEQLVALVVGLDANIADYEYGRDRSDHLRITYKSIEGKSRKFRAYFRAAAEMFQKAAALAESIEGTLEWEFVRGAIEDVPFGDEKTISTASTNIPSASELRVVARRFAAIRPGNAKTIKHNLRRILDARAKERRRDSVLVHASTQLASFFSRTCGFSDKEADIRAGSICRTLWGSTMPIRIVADGYDKSRGCETMRSRRRRQARRCA